MIKVPSAEHGLKRATHGLIEGLIVSAVVNAFAPILSKTGQSIAVIVRLLSVISAVILLEKNEVLVFVIHLRLLLGSTAL